MAIIRVVHDSGYTCISNKMLQDKSLSWKAKGLLSYMLTCKDDWNFSVEGLSTFSSDGYTCTNTALKELIQCGYVTREQLRENGKIKDVVYTVYETPVVD